MTDNWDKIKSTPSASGKTKFRPEAFGVKPQCKWPNCNCPSSLPDGPCCEKNNDL